MNSHARSPRTLRLAMCAALVASIASCDASTGCGRDLMNASVEPSWRPAELVPDDVDLVAFFPELSQLARALDLAREALPPELGVPEVCAESARQLGLDACDVVTWERAGFDLDAPAVLALDAGRLVLLARLSDPTTPARALPGDRAVSLPRGEGVVLALGAHAVLQRALPSPSAADDDTPAWLARWASVRPGLSWESSPTHRGLRDALIPHGPFYAVFRPGSWLADVSASNTRALDLRERMRAQSGRVGVVGRQDASGSILLRVLTATDRGAPQVVPSLGRARGPLPRLGGLIEPGVLGVVRVSLDPVSALDLARSGLAARERDQLEALLMTLEREVALDVEDAVFSNLVGHAVAVVYGLEIPEEPHGSLAELFLDALTGRLTHEALILPISDSDRLALFLDALTQLSRGRLVRQRVDGILQYAWFGADRELSAGALLTPEHLVLVDSAVSFNHAIAHARAPSDLSPSLSRLGLDRLLDGEGRSGFYLDADALETLLGDRELAVVGPWLEPLDHVLIVTREATPFGVTDVTLGLAREP